MQKLLYSGRINLKMIRCFLVVAEELHFGKAAERLCISQPPLSAHIKELEIALGFKLLTRDSRNVTLTHAGESMLHEMKDLFETISHSLGRVCYAGRQEEAHLNIGMISSALWHHLWLEKLKTYQKLYPRTDWTLYESPPFEQQTALLNRKLDVGFWRCADLGDDSILVTQKIDVQRIVVAVSKDNHLAYAKEISLSNLSGQPFIFLHFHHSTYSKNLYKHCLNAGCIPKKIYQFNEPQTQLAMVNNNFGIALVPESTQDISWPNINFIPLKEQLSADLFAIYHPENKSQHLNNLLKLFSS